MLPGQILFIFDHDVEHEFQSLKSIRKLSPLIEKFGEQIQVKAYVHWGKVPIEILPGKRHITWVLAGLLFSAEFQMDSLAGPRFQCYLLLYSPRISSSR